MNKHSAIHPSGRKIVIIKDGLVFKWMVYYKDGTLKVSGEQMELDDAFIQARLNSFDRMNSDESDLEKTGQWKYYNPL